MPTAAVRETLEETGVAIDVPHRPLAAIAAHDVLDYSPGPEKELRYHYSVVHVLGFASADAKPAPGDDAADAKWFRTGLLSSSSSSSTSLEAGAGAGAEEGSVADLMAAGVLVPEVLDVLRVAKVWVDNGLHETQQQLS